MVAWAAVPCQAGIVTQAVDLGATRTWVRQQLGNPLRAWSPSHCPAHRIELRRRGSLWLKLVYGPDQLVRAAGLFRLALGPATGSRGQRRVILRWPGLAPGAGSRSAYPAAENWRPLLWSIGAKQWTWIEESVDPADPPGRSRFLGGVVVDDASGFAAGTGFPHDVAEAITASGVAHADWAQADMSQPLLAWRSRTPPNAYVETHEVTEEPDTACGSLALAMPSYTDFRAGGR